MVINTRFPMLSAIAKILWIIAIIMIITGLFSIISELIEFSKLGSSGSEWVWTYKDITKIIVSAIFIPFGFTTMAVAETIGVFFAIELNTRTDNK